MTRSVELIPFVPDEPLVLRDGDVRECAKGGMTPQLAILTSLDASLYAYKVLIDGEVVAVWGYMPSSILGNVCRAWMLSCPAIERHAILFAAVSRKILAHLTQQYSRVIVHVDPEYTTAVTWLHWLGFERVGTWGPFDQMEKK